jgi:hypothetical protein
MRSTTQLGALVFGLAFLLVGILGLFVDGGLRLEADPDRVGHLLGLFPVNLLHNLVHLAFGIWGIAASRGQSTARTFGRLAAGVYALLVVLAFISPTLFGLVPIGGHVIWLHALLALGLAWVGFAAGAQTDRTVAA